MKDEILAICIENVLSTRFLQTTRDKLLTFVYIQLFFGIVFLLFLPFPQSDYFGHTYQGCFLLSYTIAAAAVVVVVFHMGTNNNASITQQNCVAVQNALLFYIPCVVLSSIVLAIYPLLLLYDWALTDNLHHALSKVFYLFCCWYAHMCFVVLFAKFIHLISEMGYVSRRAPEDIVKLSDKCRHILPVYRYGNRLRCKPMMPAPATSPTILVLWSCT